MTRIRRLASSAAMLGLAIGIGAALTVPRTSRSAGPATGATVVAAPLAQQPEGSFLPLTGTVKVAAARPVPADYTQLRVRPGSMHDELRRQDPAGGPDWVLRTFVADRVTPASYRRHGVSPIIGHGPCAQLGREVDGRFGWIDGSNTFRPSPAALGRDVLITCFSSTIGSSQQPELQATSLVGNPLGEEPVLRGGVIWGITGRPVQSVSLTAAGRTDRPELSPRIGAFLEFYGPGRSPADVEMRTQYPTGGVKTRALSPPEMVESAARMMAKIRRGPHAPKVPPFEPIVPSTVQLAARTADPGGGPSWGLMVGQTKSGYWCTLGDGSVVGNRVGQIDPTYGLFTEQDEHGPPNGCTKYPFDAKTSTQFQSSYGTDTMQQRLIPARGKLRLQPGRTVYAGLVDPNADLLTVVTPRGTRSIVPSGPAHAIITVWDGTFQGGNVTFEVHMKDGTVRSHTESSGTF